jgi:hypothetical protein
MQGRPICRAFSNLHIVEEIELRVIFREVRCG